jgi:tetratricopeptide (TPR) repeat protein
MLRFSAFVWPCVLLAIIALLPRAARADALEDRAAAEALYQLGQKLMKEGDFKNACPKLEASQALDPGVGTLLLLGDCSEKLGKLASAWAAFREASQLASSRNDRERVNIAEIRATALRPRLTYIIYKVHPDNDVRGFELHRGELNVPKASWGVRLPTNAGHYEVVASAPDRATWRTEIDVPIKLEAPLVVEVPALGAAPKTAPSAVEGEAASGISQPALNSAQSGGARSSSAISQKTLGAIVFGVGAVAVISSGILTLLATDKNNESKDNCDPADQNLCSRAGVNLRDDAKKRALFATITGLGGGALLAAGAVLYLTAPRDDAGKMNGLMLGLHGKF